MINYNNNDYNGNNDNNGNNGNKGKFSDRLKKMRRDRLRKKKYGDIDDEEKLTLKDFGRNIFKVVLALPIVVYTHVTDKSNKNNSKVGKRSEKNINAIGNFESVGAERDNLKNAELLKNNIDKRIKVSKIRDIDVSLLKKRLNSLSSNEENRNDKELNIVKDIIAIEDRKVQLQKEIIDLIKKKLVENINELEVLHSELYILNELEAGNTYLSACQEDIKEIKKLLSKVKALKENYDFLKDSVDFEYLLEFNDDFLIDKILELKEICSRDDIKNTIEDYKILDEYKYLYLKIDKLQEDMFKYEDEKKKKAKELEERDINFDKLKDSIYDVDRENERYNRFVKQQEAILNDLDEKVNQITSYERVTYKLKGFNQLLGNSFKYLGLLLVNPLKGLVPGIATQTLVTKNTVQNLYKNLEWEENRKMVYEAIDDSLFINSVNNSLEDMSKLVDSTLDDIVKLKREYKRQFSKYEESFSSYKDAMKKLNKIENSVVGSKVKIEVMRKRAKEKELENSHKMKRVKRLNSSGNS